MAKSYEFAHQYNPELADLLKQLFAILMRPFIALRAKFYRTFLRPFRKLEGKNFPVFRIGIIVLAFMFLQNKEVSFSFNMNNPAALATKIAPSHQKERKVANETPKAKPTSQKMPENDYAPLAVKQVEATPATEYIQKYKDVARAEMKKYGVPASITLAQALIESRAGSSRLAKNNNNHFGVKCFSKKCAKNHCTNHKDDHHKDFFRKYNSVWESYRNHSEFLTKGRYVGLKNHGKDYKKWAKGLKKAGYATDKSYDKKLIAVIERYKLQQYDK